MSRKISSILLSAILLLNSLCISVFAESLVPKIYQIEIFSVDFDDRYVFIYEFENKFYMTVQDITEMTRYNIKDNDNELIIYQGVREISINKKTHEMNDSYIVDQGKIPLIEFDKKYFLECIPMLNYLGAECTLQNNKLYINMPKITIWETMDYHYKQYNRDISSWCGNKSAQTTTLICDLVMEIINPFTNLNVLSNSDEYIDAALYSILDVDISKYESVNTCIAAENKIIESFIKKSPVVFEETKNTIDFIDKVNNSDEELYKTLRYLALDEQITEYEKLSNTFYDIGELEECSTLSKKINQSICEQTELLSSSYNVSISKADIATFILGTANTYTKYALYETTTRRIFSNALTEDICRDAKITPSWKPNAEHITEVLSSKPSMLTEAAADEAASFITNKAEEIGITQVILALTDSKGSIYSIIPGLANLITGAFYYDMLNAYSADWKAMLLGKFQESTSNMLANLLLDSNKKVYFQNNDKLNQLRNVYVLYYQMTLAYYENIYASVNEFGSVNKVTYLQTLENTCEEIAERLYRISNCTIIAIKPYNELRDTVFTSSNNLMEITSLYTPKYWYYDNGQVKFMELIDTNNNIVYTEAFNQEGKCIVSGIPKEVTSSRIVVKGKDYIDMHHSYDNISRVYYDTDFYFNNNGTVYQEILYTEEDCYYISKLSENYIPTSLEKYNADNTLSEKNEYLHNSYNQIVEWKMYDASEQMYKYSILEYNYNTDDYPISVKDYLPNGLLKRNKMYHSQGIISETTVFFENGYIDSFTRYDLTGQILERTFYTDNGIIYSHQEFDENEKNTKTTWYDENGIINCIGEYNYNEELIVAYWYDTSGNLTNTVYYY